MSFDPYKIKPWFELISIAIGIAIALGLAPRIKRGWFNFISAIRSFSEMPASIGRLEMVGAQAAIDISQVREDLGVMKQTMQVRLDSDPTLGYFECDTDGTNIVVNETYRKWLNADPDDLLGLGFLNYIPERERDDVRDEWMSCLKERRIYRKEHHLIGSDGKEFLVSVKCEPVPTHGPIRHWVGTIRRVNERRRYDD